MALLDCAINKKCCSVDEGWSICPLVPTVGDLTAQESPPPGICHPGRGGGGGCWAQVELTDA